ncbi:hypothetical protein Droror1_Dr00006370 [Drosera rotundifolia]
MHLTTVDLLARRLHTAVGSSTGCKRKPIASPDSTARHGTITGRPGHRRGALLHLHFYCTVAAPSLSCTAATPCSNNKLKTIVVSGRCPRTRAKGSHIAGSYFDFPKLTCVYEM